MSAAPGTVVKLYVDLMRPVEVGHVIETGTGRRYGVVQARVQQRGRHAQRRQHLACVVLEADEQLALDTVVHRIRWYKRGKRGGSR